MRLTIQIAELAPTPWPSFGHARDGETTMSTAKFAGRSGRMTMIAATAGASVLGLTLTTGPVALAADTALIMGASGVPTPSQSYVDAVENLYLVPNGYGAYTPQVLTTPEQFYPVTGVNSETPDVSVAQGVTILNSAINQQIAAGNHVTVFGYSQSAVVASQEMAQLSASSNPPSPSQLSFVLVGDEANPNGGIITRFEVPGAPLSLPSLGATFNEAPTAGSIYPTAVYTQEYDGFADFPEYPIDVLSDLNAYVGVFTQHFGYADLTPQQISSAIPLSTTGDTTTKYYMVPTANLPLLAPVRLIPLIGDPLADLVQPDLAVLVNLGYGSITNGWSPGPANVTTPFGLLPTNINVSDLVTALGNGAVQGVTGALNDLKSPQLFDTSGLSLFLAGLHTVGDTPSNNPTLLQLLAAFATIGNAGVPVTSSGGIVNTLTSVVSGDLAVGQPIAGTVQTLAETLPQYDAELFTSQLQAGNPLNAIGLPIAGDAALGLYTLIFGAVFPVVGAAATTVTQLAELTGLEPNPDPPAAAPASTASTASTNTPAVTPKVTPVTGQVTPATPKISPVTPQVTTVTPQVSPVAPKVTTSTTKTSPAGTPTNGPTFATGNKFTPAANTTTPPAGSHHGKHN
jgi:hypothetical protein